MACLLQFRVTCRGVQLKHLRRERLVCFNLESSNSSSNLQLKLLKRLEQDVNVIEKKSHRDIVFSFPRATSLQPANGQVKDD